MIGRIALAVGLFACGGAANAGFILEIDTDGADDGVLTFNPGFSFGGDTDAASQSASATAFGTTGGDSIFGGNGVQEADTYVYTYSPDSQADNLAIPAGTNLGEGNMGTGVVGGGAGTYLVYALWPFTNNVSGGMTTYDVSTAGDSFQIPLDQNSRGDAWALLGTIDYTGGAITVTQTSTINSFISMRASGLLFEAIPGPSSAAVLLFAGGLVGAGRRR